MTVTVHLAIEDGPDLGVAREVAREAAVELSNVATPSIESYGPQVEPITTVLLAGAGAVALAKFAFDWWERRKGGLVVDQSEQPVRLRRDSNLAYGYVVMISADGRNASVDVRDAPKDAVERLLEKLIEAKQSTMEAVIGEASSLGLKAEPTA